VAFASNELIICSVVNVSEDITDDCQNIKNEAAVIHDFFQALTLLCSKRIED
jgi:hypothetical protein